MYKRFTGSKKSTTYIPSLSGLALLPVFTRGEVQQIEAAYDFLLRARIALHALFMDAK
ncbi:MAG: hypothetical protein IPO06_27810 [Leptospiraceae bacterium]|nr:hypothetical protein [Leptospiraceae bacterium]